jgi:hypothetical protein
VEKYTKKKGKSLLLHLVMWKLIFVTKVPTNQSVDSIRVITASSKGFAVCSKYFIPSIVPPPFIKTCRKFKKISIHRYVYNIPARTKERKKNSN